MNEKKLISLIPGAAILTSKVAVFIPATVGGSAVDNSAEVDNAAALLSGLFGGATIQPGAGCWLSDSGALVKEATTTVYAFCSPEAAEDHAGAVVDFMQRIKAEMQQEAVAIEIDGKMIIF